MRRSVLAAIAITAGSCSPGSNVLDTRTLDGGSSIDAVSEMAADTPVALPGRGTTAFFDLDADTTRAEQFYAMPYPNDLRLGKAGGPDLRGFSRPSLADGLLAGILEIAQERRGFPVIPVAYFTFTGPLASQDGLTVFPAEGRSPILLLDVDTQSDERGKRFPVVASTLDEDGYVPPNTLAAAARPGFVLRAGRRYAFVVLRDLGDAAGNPLGVATALESLKSEIPSTSERISRARALYAPLWETLKAQGISPDDVATATVFTTGNVVADTALLGDRVTENFDIQIENLRLAEGDSPATHPRFCQLQATVAMPQFQRGVPPFDTEGLFELDDQGLPSLQSYPSQPNYARVPIALTLPRRPMPPTGFPLAMYFHGSGGRSTSAIDRGTWKPVSSTAECVEGASDTYMGVAGCFTQGEGPAFVLAARGIGVVGAALPMNPERMPGAGETAYLNLNNLKAFRDTFRQGVLEQRLLMKALGRLRFPSELVSQCAGVVLPAAATEARYDLSRLVVQGQSMGGMYTNLIAATDSSVRAAIPTGAGGYWSYFILQSELIPKAPAVLGLLLATRATLSFMHPALSLLETAWEPVEPLVYMPRLAHDPLPGHPVRPTYQPVGKGDSYFPTTVYDATALAYGHNQVGLEVWPSMQTALGLDGRGGLLAYPATNNCASYQRAEKYTGVVVQYAGDGLYDPHALYAQLDAVKYQYSCFVESFVRTGFAIVPSPVGQRPDAPCE